MEGKYYDGLSSAAHSVNIFFAVDALIIEKHESDGTINVIRWQVRKITFGGFNPAGTNILRYGEFPFQTLEIGGEVFNKLKHHYNHIKFARSKYSFAFRGIGGVLALTLLAISILAGAYFLIIPWVADAAAQNLPYGYEHKLGETVFNTMTSEMNVDSAKTVALNAFLNEMNPDTEYALKGAVVKDDIINAFALPGGFIVVYDSILQVTNNYESLAGLLAHEYAHVKLHHSTRAMFRNLSGYLFISILVGDMSGISAILLQNADNLKSLQYNRKLESEADEEALRILHKNQIDPNGMVQLFTALQKQEQKNTFDKLEFLSTHPLLENRVKNIKDLIKNNPPQIKHHPVLQTYFSQLHATSANN